MVGDNSNKKGIRKKFIDSNFFELPLKESSNASCTNYLYDIEVAGHPSFVSNGVLVHNTATPYRLSTDRFGGSILKFITRTRPRIFQKLIYYIQNKELFDNGYLAKIEYYQVNLFDVNRLRLNSTGADYTDESVKAHMREINFSQLLLKVTKRLVYVRKNVLVFTRFITDAEELLRHFPNGAIVTGKTKKKEREQILADFKSGRINLVVNVGTLTVGFDYPELETIVMARPTRSLRLYYQIIGRGIRPHKLKNSMWAVDLCDNYNRFGKIEDLTLTTEKPGMDLWVIKSGSKQLTNRYF
jgi:DNA repair protein RadD